MAGERERLADGQRSMRLLILYFSGTGNTDYVARYLARRLADSEVEVTLRTVEQQPAEALPEFDLLALGFPVYAGDSPPLVQDYLAGLPEGRGRGAFVFCTKGAFAGEAVALDLGRLAARGYAPLGGGSVTMPGTDGLAMVGKGSRYARAALEKDYDHLADADRLTGRMARAIEALAQGRPVESLRQDVWPSFGGRLAGRLWRLLYDAGEAYARSRLAADERCVGCGLCERVCPTGNVEVREGHACFGERCLLCLRCLHACPEEAVQVGWLTVNKFRWRGPRGEFRPREMRPREG